MRIIIRIKKRKTQNVQFNLKFGTYTKNNGNSMALFTFSVLYWKHPIWYAKLKEARLSSLRPYRSRDFEIGRYQFGFFILLRWVRTCIVFCYCLMNFIWIIILVKKLSSQVLNFSWNTDQSFTNETQMDKFRLNC